MTIRIPDGFTREDLLRCVGRELRMRERVYPHRIQQLLMTQKDADREMATMRAVYELIAQIPEKPAAQLELGKR